MASTATAPQTILSPTKVSFQKPAYARDRRLSSTSSTTSTENSGSTTNHPHEAFEQDWSTITADHDTWAARERRRSNAFNKIDSYPTITQKASSVGSAGSPTSPSFLAVNPRGERRGSILSLWAAGTDSTGQAILHSDDHGDWVEEVQANKLQDISETKEQAQKRGSILSMWKKGKDENGRNIILSGDLDEDLIARQAKEDAAEKARLERIARLQKQMESLKTELETEQQSQTTKVPLPDVKVEG